MIAMKLNDVNMNARKYCFYYMKIIVPHYYYYYYYIVLYYYYYYYYYIVLYNYFKYYKQCVFVCVEPRKMVRDRDFVFNCSE